MCVSVCLSVYALFLLTHRIVELNSKNSQPKFLTLFLTLFHHISPQIPKAWGSYWTCLSSPHHTDTGKPCSLTLVTSFRLSDTFHSTSSFVGFFFLTGILIGLTISIFTVGFKTSISTSCLDLFIYALTCNVFLHLFVWKKRASDPIIDGSEIPFQWWEMKWGPLEDSLGDFLEEPCGAS